MIKKNHIDENSANVFYQRAIPFCCDLYNAYRFCCGLAISPQTVIQYCREPFLLGAVVVRCFIYYYYYYFGFQTFLFLLSNC